MMKPLFWLAWSLTAAVALAETQVAESKIKQVTVFTDRARVVREATVQLPEGVSEWTFPRLPAGILDDSVQVSGEGTVATSVLDVVTRNERITRAPDERVQQLERTLTALDEELHLAEQKRASLVEHRNLINKIENAATTVPSGDGAGLARPSFEDWKQLLEFSSNARANVSAEELSLRKQIGELNDQKEKMQAQLNDIRGRFAGERNYKTVTVRLAAPSAGSVALRIAYVVGNAYWRPQYDARYDSTARKLTLGYFGQVRQATGEDWNEVALTLSTAKPGLGGGAPELQPWFIDVQRPMPPPMPAMRAQAVAEEMDMSYATAKSVAPSSVLFGQGSPKGLVHTAATVDIGATSASFVIAAPTTVLADNAPRKVSVSTNTLDATSDYQSTPKLAETAFLTASITNTSDVPFLPGEASVYLDEQFITKTPLKLVMPQEKFELALGADEGIAVKRKVVNRFNEETGIIGKNRRVTFESVTTITNNKRTPEKVTVREVLPTSQDERIVVKLQAPNARDITREEGGKLVWKLELKPGEKRELPLKFTVEHPADVTVTGLQ